jgi:hypothetical protein
MFLFRMRVLYNNYAIPVVRMVLLVGMVLVLAHEYGFSLRLHVMLTRACYHHTLTCLLYICFPPTDFTVLRNVIWEHGLEI